LTGSYQALPAQAATVFRLLAAHPGPEFSAGAAAALTAVRPSRQALGVLVGAHLLEQLAADRYQFHDLVRSYAMGEARDKEPAGRLKDASRRVLLWYLRSADAAQPWVNPIAARVPLPTNAGDEQPPESFGSQDEAIRWTEEESGNLMGAVRAAAEQGLHEIAWKLAVVLRALHMRLSLLDDWLATSQIGLRSAQALGDLAGQAQLLESIGSAYSLAYDLDQGEDYLRRAVEIQRQADDRPGTAYSLNILGVLQLRRHHPTNARAVLEEALDICASLGGDQRVPVIRANLALALIDLGDYQEADDLLRSVLPIFRERGDVLSEGNALRLHSAAQRGLGNLDLALAAAQGAVELAIGQGNTLREAYWLLEVGTVQRLAGRLDEALGSFQRSADLQRRLGHKVREAQAWDGEGEVQRELGHLAEAIELHGRAADAFRALSARWLLAVALGNLATALRAAGRGGQAREAASEALQLLAEFPDPAAERLRTALNELA
jgi:tetratricopeptide (TPR) repeat protein